MDRGWRESAEQRLEGCGRYDRTSFGAFGDACSIIWSVLVLAWLILIKVPYGLVRWAMGKDGRTTPQRAATETAEGLDNEGRPIHRYGYY